MSNLDIGLLVAAAASFLLATVLHFSESRRVKAASWFLVSASTGLLAILALRSESTRDEDRIAGLSILLLAVIGGLYLGYREHRPPLPQTPDQRATSSVVWVLTSSGGRNAALAILLGTAVVGAYTMWQRTSRVDCDKLETGDAVVLNGEIVQFRDSLGDGSATVRHPVLRFLRVKCSALSMPE